MKVLITAGPTREPIDPVRYLTNRSSGKMGYALAGAALAAGHEVILISGPVSLTPPGDTDILRVETAEEMFEAVASRILEADAAILCAAVADYRPAEMAAEKIKKSDDELTLTLVKTPDILDSCRTEFGFDGILVGFAAETENVESNALDKLRRKGCDFLVANDVSLPGLGFDSDDNAVVIYAKGGSPESIGPASKSDIAAEIVARIFA